LQELENAPLEKWEALGIFHLPKMSVPISTIIKIILVMVNKFPYKRNGKRLVLIVVFSQP